MTNAEQLETISTTKPTRAPVAWKVAMHTNESKTVTIIFPQLPAENMADPKLAENQSAE